MSHDSDGDGDGDGDSPPGTDGSVTGVAGETAADTAATYDRIAPHFAATREYAWPEVEAFLEGRTGTVALDVGCGNGRHTETLVDHADTVVGLDVSRGLLDEARTRAASRSFAASFVHGDAASLPFSTAAVDVALYVATIHHLHSRERRVASLDELARVLASDGIALVSAWATVHDRFADEHGDATVGFDTHVDWTLPGGETVPRFYHIYAREEFEADVEASTLELVDCRVSSGNCYAVVRSGE